MTIDRTNPQTNTGQRIPMIDVEFLISPLGRCLDNDFGWGYIPSYLDREMLIGT